MEVKLKLLVFSFVLLVMQKVKKKVETVNIHSDCKTTNKGEQTQPEFLHAVGKYENVESINTQNHYKTRVKNEEIKRKQICSVSFVKVFKFQENKFKILQKNF